MLSGAVRPGAAWMAEYHSFGWLHDLRAVDADASRVARMLLDAWIRRNGSWNSLSWRPDILSSRMCNWYCNAEFLSLDEDRALAGMFLDSLARQTRHLRRVSHFVDEDLDRLLVDKALLYSALCLAGGASQIPGALRRLSDTCERQFLPDGGHIRRNPTLQLEALRQLVEILATVEAAGLELPEAFHELVHRVAAMTRFYRLGDRKMALFNGAEEGETPEIDLVLKRVRGRVSPPASAPDTGFERIEARRTLLIIDAGQPISGMEGLHAGTLSFELSVGRQRMVVNCGGADGGDESWKSAQRSTAAHSTLVVEDRNSSSVRQDGALGTVPTTVTCERTRSEDQTVLDMTHDGYRAQFDLVHMRRIAVDHDGNLVSGRDVLTGSGAHRFVVRFHLHPTVKASLLKGGASVLLRMIDGSGWRFRCDRGSTSLQESVYLGQSGQMRRSEQIVVSGATAQGQAVVEWSFARL